MTCSLQQMWLVWHRLSQRLLWCMRSPVQTKPELVDLHVDLPHLMSGTVMELSAMFVDKMTCKD